MIFYRGGQFMDEGESGVVEKTHSFLTIEMAFFLALGSVTSGIVT